MPDDSFDSLDIEKTIEKSGQSGGYTLAPGEILGQYRVVRPLGRGGMGEVCLAVHAILKTRHALKLLPRERSGDPAFVARFRDEAFVMAQLRHPAIVPVTYADEAAVGHYLVMEFVAVDGGEEPCDLEEALAAADGKRLPPATAARLGAEICEAVAAAGGARAAGKPDRRGPPRQ